MKIAVAYENGEIYGTFANCPQYALYEYGEYVSDCVKTLIDTSELEGNAAMADRMTARIAAGKSSSSQRRSGSTD